MTSQDPHFVQPCPSFDEILQSSSLPEPGPEYYAARRKLWLTHRPGVTRPPPPTSASRQKLRELQDVTSQPGAVHNQDIWRQKLEKVWKGLSSGGKPSISLPMTTVIQIIHAAWLRDNTWPVGLEAPDTGDERQAEGAPSVEFTTTTPQPSYLQTFNSFSVMEPIPPRKMMSRR